MLEFYSDLFPWLQAYEYISEGDEQERRPDAHLSAGGASAPHSQHGAHRAMATHSGSGAGRGRDDRVPSRRYDALEPESRAWQQAGPGPTKHTSMSTSGSRSAAGRGAREPGGRDGAARPQSAGFRLHATGSRAHRPPPAALHPALRPQSAPAVRKDMLAAQPRRSVGREGWDGGRSGGPIRPGDSGQCRLQAGMVGGRGGHGDGGAREGGELDSDNGDGYEDVMDEDFSAQAEEVYNGTNVDLVSDALWLFPHWGDSVKVRCCRAAATVTRMRVRCCVRCEAWHYPNLPS